MKTWTRRSKEGAYLLNPAFCSTTLTATIFGYSSVNDTGLPFPLVFSVLPIVLHKPTREALPRDTRTSMASWLQGNPFARVLFYERLISLKPYTWEAVHFGILYDWIAPKSGGLLETTINESDIGRIERSHAAEARECLMRARFLGKWFAKAGAVQTVMALWGVRP